MSQRPRGRLLLEMVVIVFSVLVALVANEWRQGVARASTVETVLGTVRREAEANRAEVATVRQYQRLVDTTVSRIVDFLYASGTDGDMTSALSDLVTFEAALLEAYDRLLALRLPAATPTASS
jgi:hypothetical protein